MEHRKKYHAKLVKLCMNFMRGKCQFQNEFCWFIHKIPQDKKTTTNDDSKAEEEMETESVFQKEKEKMKPPSQGEQTNIKRPN